MAGSHEDAGRRGERVKGGGSSNESTLGLVGLVWGSRRCINDLLMQPTSGAGHTMHAICTGRRVGVMQPD